MIRNPIGPRILPGILPALAAALLLSPSAQAEVLRLDPDSTEVGFSLGSTFHEVEGRFDLTEGEICFDPRTGEASGRVVVDSGSGSTDNAKRDKKMHNKVLESLRFGEFLFLPERLEGEFHPGGESDLSLFGTLEIHGTAHDITMSTHVKAVGDRIAGTAHFTVPYVAWGMKDPSVFMFRVAKEVEVHLTLEGSLGTDLAGIACGEPPARTRATPGAP